MVTALGVAVSNLRIMYKMMNMHTSLLVLDMVTAFFNGVTGFHLFLPLSLFLWGVVKIASRQYCQINLKSEVALFLSYSVI